jgi:hypothetical protein
MPDVFSDCSSDLPGSPHRVLRWSLVCPVSRIVAVPMTVRTMMGSALIVVFLSPQRLPQTLIPPLCLFDLCTIEHALR